ncbi:MAG: hypothetical protein H8D56_00845 [Planctomycetes bacterium]|nr:hypothetical protein [Planctomycetota bacterium]
MRCKYVKLKLDRYIQGDLPDSVSKKIERHVSSCQGCADTLSRIRKLQGLFEDTSVPGVPEGFTERLMQYARHRQFQKASEPKIIRVWEWFDGAGLRKAAVAAGIIIGLSIGLLMGLQTSRQSYKTQVVASSALVDAYHFDYLTEAPENSISGVYIQMVSGESNFEE